MTNVLETVQTYQRANLAFLQNLNCFISTANTKYKEFEKISMNLGSSVTYDVPPEFYGTPSLIAVFQPATQRVRTLTVNKQESVAYTFSAQELIFNVDKNGAPYLPVFVEAATRELGTIIEADVAGLCETIPYRFYDGTAGITSYGQLAQALALYRNYGTPNMRLKAYISDLIEPGIVTSGLNQFAMTRNNDIAMSWEIGNFSNCDFYRSNLLPIHTAGTVGQAQSTLTVISISGDGTQITCSGAGTSITGAVLQYDSAYFLDGVSGKPNMRYLTASGQIPCGNPVQMQVTADAASNGSGNVVLNVFPALISASGVAQQNINNPVVAGMQIKVLNTHRCGMIVGGNALYLAMPQLPDQSPYATGNESDKETGVSMRMTYGSQFGLNQTGFIHDAIWGKDAVPQYCYKIAMPV